jgi:SNW domain-containing protein 1
MHSPPRKVSAEEQKNWVIPACISNWKNNKGYTIPLDKRLAADGRGLQEVTINDNFAKLSEALFIADRHAREEVKLRSEMQAKLASKEKKEKEERLRMLAQKAREERAGLVSGGRTTSPDRPGSPSHKRGGISLPDYGSSSDETSGSESEEEEEELTQEEKQRLKEREQIRRDKAKQREKELRLSHMGTETKARVLSERYLSFINGGREFSFCKKKVIRKNLTATYNNLQCRPGYFGKDCARLSQTHPVQGDPVRLASL